MPSPTAAHCRQRAEAADRAAGETSLANVRERELRARDTWLEMAERAERVAEMRDRQIAEKRAQAEDA